MSQAERSQDLERLGELAARGARGSIGESEQRFARQAFMAKVDEELAKAAPNDGSRWRFSLARHWPAPVGVMAVAALAVFAFLPRGLHFEVIGATSEGGYVRAPLAQSVEVRFSDQTNLVASAGSRLRVEETTSSGARVLLERGSAQVHVVHQPDSAWNFVAGPFDVHVTGTRFELAWDPGAETIDLVLIEGSVEVRGFSGSGPVSVRTGQRFRGDALRRTMVVTDAAAPEAQLPPKQLDTVPTTGVARGDAAPELPPTPEAAKPGTSAPSHAPAETWSKLIAQGKFTRIVDEALQRGVPSCLESCGAADLRALADAARYTAHGDIAEQSLLALRKRFASDAGRGAAFLLGRLYENRGAVSRARTWYDTYLRESPSGDFASEALAGKMRTVNALEGQKSAEPIAREYLRRYPSGVHAKPARQIAGTN